MKLKQPLKHSSILNPETLNPKLNLKQVDALVQKHSKAAGGLCLGAMFLHILCGHLSAKVFFLVK
jgi:hypothetical protein